MEIDIRIFETEAGWRIDIDREWAGNVIHHIHSEPHFRGYLAVSSHGNVVSESFRLPGAAIDYVIKAHMQHLHT